MNYLPHSEPAGNGASSAPKTTFASYCEALAAAYRALNKAAAQTAYAHAAVEALGVAYAVQHGTIEAASALADALSATSNANLATINAIDALPPIDEEGEAEQ